MAITTTTSTSISCMKLQSLIIVGLSSKIHVAFLPQQLPNPTFCHSSLSCRYLPSSKKNKRHLSNASSEEVPAELKEDSKFVPLNADDPIYGPPLLLLLGFEVEEASKVKQFLKDLDGEFLEVIYCIEDMIDRSLWDVMNTKQQIVEDLKFLWGLGLPKEEAECYDVYGLDDELIGMVPRPLLDLLVVLFPYC